MHAVAFNTTGLPNTRPYLLEWNSTERPLPERLFRSAHHQSSVRFFGSPDYYQSGPTDRPFDLGGHLQRLSADICATCAELRHVNMAHVVISATTARTRRPEGLQARVTPLRFRNGALTRHRNGREYQVQRHRVDGREILYLLTFCLPRFLDLDFDEKFITLFHELFHIGPNFDGDIRRHAGRYHVHSHSKSDYDRQMAGLVRTYLTNGADPALHAFMRLNFTELIHRHGSIRGIVLPRPKILPLPPGRSPTAY